MDAIPLHIIKEYFVKNGKVFVRKYQVFYVNVGYDAEEKTGGWEEQGELAEKKSAPIQRLFQDFFRLDVQWKMAYITIIGGLYEEEFDWDCPLCGNDPSECLCRSPSC